MIGREGGLGVGFFCLFLKINSFKVIRKRRKKRKLITFSSIFNIVSVGTVGALYKVDMHGWIPSSLSSVCFSFLGSPLHIYHFGFFLVFFSRFD